MKSNPFVLRVKLALVPTEHGFKVAVTNKYGKEFEACQYDFNGKKAARLSIEYSTNADLNVSTNLVIEFE